MAYKSRAEALSSITRRSFTIGSKTYEKWDCYLGTNPVTREPKRISRSSKSAAEDEVRRFYKMTAKSGDAIGTLTPMQALDAKTAIDAIAEAGASITLTECAKRALAQISASERLCMKKVSEVYAEYLSTDKRNATSLELKAVKSRTGKWAETFADSPISSITAKSVLEYLDGGFGSLAAKTWNNHFKYISTFLSWCVKKPRCYLSENPVSGIDAKPMEWSEPECITVEDARRLFSALEGCSSEHPEYIVYAALSFFCGVRREEILRMAGKNSDGDDGRKAFEIDIPSRFIRIIKVKGYRHGMKPRAFEIPETACAWLKSVDFSSALPMIGEHTVDGIYEIGRESGARIPKNCGRHSFITYHVCAYENFQKTLLIVGHLKQGTSEDHYRALRRKEEGLAYFSILPSA